MGLEGLGARAWWVSKQEIKDKREDRGNIGVLDGNNFFEKTNIKLV